MGEFAFGVGSKNQQAGTEIFMEDLNLYNYICNKSAEGLWTVAKKALEVGSLDYIYFHYTQISKLELLD